MAFGIISHYRFDILPTGGGIDWRRRYLDPGRTPDRIPGRRIY